MKTIRIFISELLDPSNREVVKTVVSTLGVTLGMTIAYYFIDRL